MFNRHDKKKYLCLVPDHSGKASSLLPLIMMLAVDFSSMPFNSFRKVPFIPNLFALFIMRRVGFCQILVLHPGDNHVIFLFYSINMIFYINRLLGVKPTLHPWDKSYLVKFFLDIGGFGLLISCWRVLCPFS